MHVKGVIASGVLTASVTPEMQIKGSVNSGQTISGVVSPELSVSAQISARPEIVGQLTIPSAVGVDPYEGEYEVTPNRAAQVLTTSGKYLQKNIVVNPIPNNYGLITWNGTTLTVS